MKMEKKAQTWPFWAILGHIVAPSRTYIKSKQWHNQGYIIMDHSHGLVKLFLIQIEKMVQKWRKNGNFGLFLTFVGLLGAPGRLNVTTKVYQLSLTIELHHFQPLFYGFI